MGNQENPRQCPKCFTQNPLESPFCNKCGADLEAGQVTLSYSPYPDKYAEDKIQFVPGETFAGRYQIIEEIGRGGMGRVYKAEDRELDIVVALKIIRPKYSSRPRFIEWFKKETLTARSISHENVIRIYDMGTADDVKYISMEYIKGQNLRDLIRASGTLTLEKSVDITCQIGYALNAAHKHGIVHRDLKPSNIMIDNNGKVYVMDFGLARAIHRSESKESKGVAGTPAYMSPEQARAGGIDQRSDIYSLGLIIYEMLTGERVFHAENTTGYIYKQIHEDPAPPSKLRPLVPAYMDKIVQKCLEKEKEKRFQKVTDLIDQMKERASSAGPLSTWKRTKKLKYAAAVVLVLVFAFIFYLWMDRMKTPGPLAPKVSTISLAVMSFENNTGDESLEYLQNALQTYLIDDLGQSKYLQVLTEEKLNRIFDILDLSETSVHDSKELSQIAKEGSIDYFLLGGIRQETDGLKIAIQILDSNSNNIIDTIEQSEVDITRIPAVIDSLTPQIKITFDITPEEIAADIDRPIGEISTESPIAQKYYIDAERMYFQRRWKKGIEILEKAVAEDPEFATAFKEIAIGYSYLSLVIKSQEYMRKALSLIHRVSERERYLIQGNAAVILENDLEKAAENYQKLIDLYPYSEDGYELLASIYRMQEEWALAMENYLKVLTINNRSEIAYNNLNYIYMAQGRYDKARKTLSDSQSLFVNQSLHHRYIAYTYLFQREFEEARKEIEICNTLDPDDYFNTRMLGYIDQIQGNFASAEDHYRQLVLNEKADAKIEGHLRLCNLYIAQGRFEQNLEEIRKGLRVLETMDSVDSKDEFQALEAYSYLRSNQHAEALAVLNDIFEFSMEKDLINRQKSVLFLRALTYADIGRLDYAENTAEQLKQLIEERGYPKEMRMYYCSVGTIAAKQNKNSEAIGHFRHACSLLPAEEGYILDHALYFNALAAALYETGEIEQAKRQYEAINSLTSSKMQWGDISTKSHYWLGKIYIETQENEKAREHLTQFLKLWKSADPGSAEIAEVRNLLSSLGVEEH